MTKLDHPFDEVVADAMKHIEAGRTVFQKFTCGGCGQRLTIDVPNRFHTTGSCDQCDHVTDIVASGCNYLIVAELP